jgi:hypothetical protein
MTSFLDKVIKLKWTGVAGSKYDELVNEKAFSVDFQIEILNSCSFNCNGCYVDKDHQHKDLAASINRLENILNQFESKNYFLDHLLIGPTDFTVATNFDFLMQNTRLVDLTAKFHTTNWVTTLNEKNFLDKFIQLKNLNKSKKVTFSIVTHLQQITSDTGFRILSEKFDLIKNIFEDQLQRVYILLNVDESNKSLFDKDTYHSLHNKISERFLVPSFDHGLSFTRTKDFEKEKTRLVTTMNWLNRLYDNVSKDPQIPIQFIMTRDYSARRFVYRDGRFYWPPLWHEPFVNFDPSFEIPIKNDRVEEFEQYEINQTVQQINYLEQNPTECSNCENAPFCLNRGVIFLQKNLNQTECIMPKKVLQERGLVYDRQELIS